MLLEAIRSDPAEYLQTRVSVELVRRRSCGCEFAVMPALAGTD